MSAGDVAAAVTAVLVTLDEEANVTACLTAVRASGIVRVIVVDASSTDRTVELARAEGANVHVVPRLGLGFQRQYGADLVTTEFTLLVDADNRIDATCVAALLAALRSSDHAGVAPRKVAADPRTYWERAWGWDNTYRHYVPGVRPVIGTPALHRTALLREVPFDLDIRGASDDTDRCLRLVRAGHTVAAVDAVCHEELRATLGGVVRKAAWYGRGDAEFFRKHPDRRWSIALHPWRGSVIGGSARALRRGRPDLVPYFVLLGVARSVGFLRGLAAGRGGAVYRT